MAPGKKNWGKKARPVIKEPTDAIGMAALLTAQFYSPAEMIIIDKDDYRLGLAKTFGATHTINSATENAVEKVLKLTSGKGVDTAIEAVGVPATFELCEELVGAGGHIANIGVHGKSVVLHLETLWSRNITITASLVDTVSTPMLFKISCHINWTIKNLSHIVLRWIRSLRRMTHFNIPQEKKHYKSS